MEKVVYSPKKPTRWINLRTWSHHGSTSLPSHLRATHRLINDPQVRGSTFMMFAHDALVMLYTHLHVGLVQIESVHERFDSWAQHGLQLYTASWLDSFSGRRPTLLPPKPFTSTQLIAVYSGLSRIRTQSSTVTSIVNVPIRR